MLGLQISASNDEQINYDKFNISYNHDNSVTYLLVWNDVILLHIPGIFYFF